MLRATTIQMSGLALLMSLGCGGGEKDPPLAPFDASMGLLGDGMVNPFPSAHLVGTDGKLAMTPDQFPKAPSDFPADLANYRTGFSPVQVATLRLPGVSCGACPKWRNPTPGEGSVLLLDRTDGVFLPVMAELDAWDDAKDPTLLIRPQEPLIYGHEVAVVVTTEAMPRPERFDTLIAGGFDTPWTAHYQGIVDQVVSMGVARDAIALAWDFPIGDGTQPTRSAVSQLQIPTQFDIGLRQDADLGDNVPSSVWRRSSGSFEVTNFVASDGWLDLDTASGEVAVVGTTDVDLVISIPQVVRDAPAGSVPVLIYGHGLLSSPTIDVWGTSNDWGVIEVADKLGMIIIATPWGGLDADSFLTAVAVANDLGQFPALSSAMVQGQVNQQSLLQLIRSGELGASDLFTGDSGQQLLDDSQVYYWGVSMGGILGGVLMAQEGADIEAGVFHVGGGAWSSLLERSSAWTQFEVMVTNAVESPAHRQLFYAASQLFWDPVDPVAYYPDLQDSLILLQESVNDDTVHNMTTRIAARAMGLPVLSPSADGPYGLDEAPADLPVGSRAMVQFDSERSSPPNENRPAPVTGAHGVILGWWEAEDQAVEFLTPGSEGQVIHYCGGAACAASNRG